MIDRAPSTKGESSEATKPGAGSMGRMGAMGGGGMAAMGGAGGGMGIGGAPGGRMGPMVGGGAAVGSMGEMGAGAAGMGGIGGGMAGMAGPAAMGGMGAGVGGMSGAGDHRGRALLLSVVSTATELAIRDKNPNTKLVLKKLEEPVSMSFIEETPLEDCLKYIKQATSSETYPGIQIYVDPGGLKEVAATMTSTVRNMDLEGVPLKTTLRLALKQLGLAFCVRDGVLIISSPQGIFDELKRGPARAGYRKGNRGSRGSRRQEQRARAA